MHELFSDRRHAFFAQASPITLGPLPADELADYLVRRLLKVIAQRTVALGSREADLRYGLAKGGSAKAAVERLFADGQLVHDETTRTGWKIVDPFLASWLRES